MPRFRRIFATATALLALAAPALAQTNPQPPPSSDLANKKGSLSEKLGATSGVIHPDEGVDPGIRKTPPATGTMPIVPPPGTPGGRTDVDPK